MNIQKFNCDGYDSEGFDHEGFDANGLHRNGVLQRDDDFSPAENLEYLEDVLERAIQNK